MKTTARYFLTFFAALLVMTGCSKPSQEQVLQALKENPGLLAEAIKKDPSAFKEALQAAQEQIRNDRAKEQQAEFQRKIEQHLKEPLQPTLGPSQVYKGSDKAKIVIVEFTDFECPYCSRGAEAMNEILKRYDGKIKVTVKHLPLPFHKNAKPAAQYFEAIRIQNPKAAMQFHDAMFANQGGLREKGEAFLEEQAKKLGVKIAKLKGDIKGMAVEKKISADMEEAKKFGFRGTPSFVVGGVPVPGALPPDEFAKIIDLLLQKGS